jgi:hypothetical protein
MHNRIREISRGIEEQIDPNLVRLKLFYKCNAPTFNKSLVVYITNLSTGG